MKLTRKLADLVDGVDISCATVGDQLHLPARDAAMLIAEGWAEAIPILHQRRATDRVAAEPPVPARRPRR